MLVILDESRNYDYFKENGLVADLYFDTLEMFEHRMAYFTSATVLIFLDGTRFTNTKIVNLYKVLTKSRKTSSKIVDLTIYTRGKMRGIESYVYTLTPADAKVMKRGKPTDSANPFELYGYISKNPKLVVSNKDARVENTKTTYKSIVNGESVYRKMLEEGM